MPEQFPHPGAVIDGRYELQRYLGGGGYGQVWRARDRKFAAVVAVKILNPELAASHRAVLLREARAARSLEGQCHVVTIHDVVIPEDPGGWPPYIVMKYVDGRDLSVLLAGEPRRRLDPARACRIVDQVAEALAHAHRSGLVHRDVKPLNILVEQGDDDTVHLVDFGLVGDDDDERTEVSLVDGGLGSFRYMAPERHGPATRRRDEYPYDVYGLACVLHECLTGFQAFPQKVEADVREAQSSCRLPQPSDVNRALTPWDQLVVDGLAVEPATRPSVTAFRTRLEAARAEWAGDENPPVVTGPKPFTWPGTISSHGTPVGGARPTPIVPPTPTPTPTAGPAPTPTAGPAPTVAPTSAAGSAPVAGSTSGAAPVTERAGTSGPWEWGLMAGAGTGIVGSGASVLTTPGLVGSVAVIGGSWALGAVGGWWWRRRHPGRTPSGTTPGVSDPGEAADPG